MSEAAVAARQVEGRTVPVAGTWIPDPAHSSFEFVARHMMAKVRGRFPDFTATVEIAERRDGHLQSADFFHVEQHPKISFQSTAVRPGPEENRWLLDGDLTIIGVTRPVTWDVEFHGATQDPWGGTRAAFSATTDVNRDESGLSWNAPLETGGFLLSKNIRLEVDVELMKQ